MAVANKVQGAILAEMYEGASLCSMRSVLGEEVRDYGSVLGVKAVSIGSVKALLRKGLITEVARHTCADGTCEGKPHFLLRITYGLQAS